MIFQNRDPDHPFHGVRLVRDLIEIIAIVVAGVWAFYVFAYENRIKPSFTDPQVDFSATMTKVGESHGLVGIRLNTEIRNIGQVRAHLIGYAIWINGCQIEHLRQPQGPKAVSGLLQLDGAFYRTSHCAPVYGYGYVTVLGDPKRTADLLLQPGDDEKSQDVFFVPLNRFGLLEAYIHARFTKIDDRPIPTKLVLNRQGLPTFVGSHENNFDFANFVSRISLM